MSFDASSFSNMTDLLRVSSDLSPASVSTKGDPYPTPLPQGMGWHDANDQNNLACTGSTQALKLDVSKLVQLGLDNLNEDSTWSNTDPSITALATALTTMLSDMFVQSVLRWWKLQAENTGFSV